MEGFSYFHRARGDLASLIRSWVRWGSWPLTFATLPVSRELVCVHVRVREHVCDGEGVEFSWLHVWLSVLMNKRAGKKKKPLERKNAQKSGGR